MNTYQPWASLKDSVLGAEFRISTHTKALDTKQS